jgi:DNA-binding beta-propeller fold protein YncE
MRLWRHVTATIAVLLVTPAGAAHADVIDYQELLISPTGDFIVDEEERVSAQLAEADPAFGPIARAYRRNGIGEGFRRVHESFRGDTLIEIGLRDFRTKATARLHVEALQPNAAETVDEEGLLSVEYDIAGPTEDHTARQHHAAIGRFVMSVTVVVDASAPTADNPLDLRNDILATIVDEQRAEVPSLPDVDGLAWGLSFAPPGADTWSQWMVRVAMPGVLALAYLLLWAGNGLPRQRLGQLLRGRRGGPSTSSRFTLVGRLSATRAHRALDDLGLRVHPVVEDAKRIRRRSRRVAVAGVGGFLLAAAATWAQPVSISLGAMVVGSLVGVAVGRWRWMSQQTERRNYRATVSDIGLRWWLGGLALSGILLSAATFLLISASMIYTFGGSANPDLAAGLRRLTVWQFVAGIVLLGMVPLAYRFLQAHARRKQKQAAHRDDRPPLLYLRSFVDDQVTLRARRTDRHHLFEYASPSARERMDEIVAWGLWATGPVVAIGEPGASVSPLGAAREYYSDDHWRDAVAYYATRAPVVCLTAGTTRGVEWELKHLMLSGALRRTVLLVPPGRPTERAQRIDLIDRVLDLGLDHERRRQLSLATVLALLVDPDGTPVFYCGRRGDDAEVQAAVEASVQRALTNAIETGARPVTVSGAPPPLQEPPRMPERSTWKPAMTAGVGLWLGFGFVGAGIPNPWPADDGLPAPTTDWEVPTCDLPVDIDVSADGHWHVASCPVLNRLSATDADAAMEVVELDGWPTAPTVLERDRAVVADRQRSVLYELDLAPLALRATHEAFDAPIADLAVTDEHVIATHPELGKISVLDRQSLDVLETVSLGQAPWTAAAHDGQVYVTDAGADVVYVWQGPGKAPRRLGGSVRGIGGLDPSDDGVWAVSRLDGEILRLGDDGVEVRVPTPPRPLDVVATGDALVVALADDRVVGLDLRGLEHWELPVPGVPSVTRGAGRMTAIGEHRRGTITFVDAKAEAEASAK